MIRTSTFVLGVFGLLALPACGSSSDSGGGGGGSGGGTSKDKLLEIVCKDAIADVYTAPADLGAAKGTILKCAPDQYLTKEELLTQAKADGYVGPDFTSGAHVYRVQFRTERGDTANSPGFSTAIVYLPDTPVAAQAPLVASAHGTVGQGKPCLISQDPTLAGGDPPAQFVPYAGAGYPVIAPDYAGYAAFGASGNPPSGYMIPGDAPKSLLDSVHALRSMMPSHAAQDVVITGHSQGGHVALSALAQVESYGIDGKLDGVVVYSPFWLSDLAWGFGAFVGGAILVQGNETAAGGAYWYFYSASELFDGAGHGTDVFAAAKKSAFKDYFENSCLNTAGDQKLDSLGVHVDDLLDPDFVKGVGAPATNGAPCPGDGSAADTFCKTWLPRLKAGRPHLTGSAKDVPVLLVYGSEDKSIPPNFATCGIDRLNADGAKLSTCVFPGVNHGGIVRAGSEYTTKWISHQTMGAADPGACPSDFEYTTDSTGAKVSDLPDGKGGKTGCSGPPSNTAD